MSTWTTLIFKGFEVQEITTMFLHADVLFVKYNIVKFC